MTPDLTVSIVLFRTPVKDLQRCFHSLENFKGRIYLYLIDNSPNDSLRNECQANLSHEYIHLPSNPGFGTAHNVAIRKAQLLGSAYHLVLNADVAFDGDVLSPMLAYMDENARVGQMMPKILNRDGSIQRLCKLVPTPIDLFLRRFYWGKARIVNGRYFELHDSAYDKIMFVPYLSGCFMLLRQSALQEVGLFDERFFMYPEDIDLTRRIAQRYETIFFPFVSVTHEHAAASYKSFRMLIIHSFNLIKYFNKWGWFYDPVRDELNHKTLKQLRSMSLSLPLNSSDV